MTKLLSANFRRLWRSVVFWVALACVCGHTLLGVLNNYYYKSVWNDPSSVIMADHTLLPDMLILTVVTAVVISVLIGREYSDKTIRNKVVTGHSRVSIYLANLIVCGVATLILYAVPLLTMGLGVGAPLMGGFELPATAFILPILCQVLGLLAFTSLFLLIVMSVSNRTLGTVAVLLLAFILMAIPSSLGEALEAPEYVEEMVFDEALDDFVWTGQMMRNQAYISGGARVICEFMYDFLPGGPLCQSSPYEKTETMWDLPLWSLAFIALSGAGGIVLFRRKELK